MKLDALRRALAAYDRADLTLAQARLDVWEALAQADPGLANELVSLFGDDQAAANWVTRSSRRLGASAAWRIAAGQRDAVIIHARRTAHGMAG